MHIRGYDIGVCSWSLPANTRATDPAPLIEALRTLNVQHLHLALNPLLDLGDEDLATYIGKLRDGGVQITATMVGFPGEDYSTLALIRATGGLVPDGPWIARRDRARHAAEITARFDLPALTTHVGFVPMSNGPGYEELVGRVCEIAEPLLQSGAWLLLETGQETPSELLQFINDLRCRNVAANFDPGNLILYGAGDPLDAVRILGRHIRHVHLKDAVLSDQPGTLWGKEVPLGSGAVSLVGLFDALHDADYAGPLLIECETSDRDLNTVAAALRALHEMDLETPAD